MLFIKAIVLGAISFISEVINLISPPKRYAKPEMTIAQKAQTSVTVYDEYCLDIKLLLFFKSLLLF